MAWRRGDLFSNGGLRAKRRDQRQTEGFREMMPAYNRTVVYREPTEPRTGNWVSGLFSLIGGLVVILLGLRLILGLLGADLVSPVASFVYQYSDPVVQPFGRLLGDTTVAGSHFETATLAAILASALITYLVVRFLGGLSRR